MFKKILLAILVLIGALLIFATTRPDTFTVQRSANINAKPEKVFGFINDFHKWEAWSPWEKMDIEMKKTFSGEQSGKGSAYTWEGKKNVGVGSMLITESTAPSQIKINLDFLKPFEAHNTLEFVIDGDKNSSKVIWSMSGKNNFFAKLMSIFVSMDKMVGKDFETGLANLKAVAEK
jgi:hypothetical protein